MQKKPYLGIAGILALSQALMIPAHAAQFEFQQFMFAVCDGSPSGDLANRCSESNNAGQEGDLSGDSEDSLIPTQSLANATNALAQTRARVQALMEKARARPGEEKNPVLDEATGTRAITDAFQSEGWSFLAQAEVGDLDRDATQLERGYETDSYLFKIGGDYRVSDTFMVGALFGIDRYEQTYDRDQPGTNFTPQGDEGDSDVTNYSLTLFTTKNFSDRAYLEAQASYIVSDYEFKRSVVFQEFSRSDPQINVDTNADTDGTQWALSIGGGLEHASGPWSLGAYTRIDYTDVTIDSYRESGGDGLAMAFEKDTSTELTGTFGLRAARAINRDFGVLVPQIFAEHVHAFDADRRRTASRFVEDAADTRFTVSGDDPDKDYQNLGVSLMAILPNGVNAFIGYTTQLNNDDIDYYRLNGGLRIEL